MRFLSHTLTDSASSFHQILVYLDAQTTSSVQMDAVATSPRPNVFATRMNFPRKRHTPTLSSSFLRLVSSPFMLAALQVHPHVFIVLLYLPGSQQHNCRTREIFRQNSMLYSSLRVRTSQSRGFVHGEQRGMSPVSLQRDA